MPDTHPQDDRSHIERLPVEIFELIISDLDLSTFAAIRTTSRVLCLLSFSTFATKFFHKLKTTLGSASLDRLVNISNHEYLSQVVTVLDIQLFNHRDYKTMKQISQVGIFPVPKRFPKFSGVKPENITAEASLYDDIVKRDYSRCIVDRLTFSLRAFTKLKKIRFYPYHNEPLGWRTAGMPEGDQLFRSRCFAAVIDAITKSEVTLEEFSMAKVKGTTTLSRGANLIYPTLAFSFESFKALQHCFANLKSLTLSVIAAHNEDFRIPGWENGIGSVVSTAPMLQNLSLSLDRNYCISHYSAAIIRSLARSCRSSNLQTFHLVNASLHEEDMALFAEAHEDSLRQISFSSVILIEEEGSWLGLWSSFQTLKNLQSLRLSSLGGTLNSVLFRKRGKSSTKIKLDTAKSGLAMSKLLEDFIADSIRNNDYV